MINSSILVIKERQSLTNYVLFLTYFARFVDLIRLRGILPNVLDTFSRKHVVNLKLV